MTSTATISTTSSVLDVERIRADFPLLQRVVNGYPLVYLDNAATSQKPTAVIRAIDDYYQMHNANVHRGVYTLSEEATEAYEGARRKVARFINARSYREVIFTRNATEAINLVAYAWGGANVGKGDEIIVTDMEHHSNFVPWQLLAQRTGATLRFIPVTPTGQLDLAVYNTLLSPRTRIVAFTGMSNVLGTITPASEIIERAHAVGARVLLDASQLVPHKGIDVQVMGADFVAFTGHKMLGPTGIGVLWGQRALLEEMPPFLGGGDMIKEVYHATSTWNELPWKFEAGTPSIAEGIGLGAAVDYLTAVGMDKIHAHERAITSYALERLNALGGITLYGPPADRRGGVVAFNVEGIHPHDLASMLDQRGVAVRAGQHCAQPLIDHLGVTATARASFYLYNRIDEVDTFVDALDAAKQVFGV
ncbi:MAG: cysteine desulfurase [Anaerolineae bacterium]|nr:cysteine desulfurase [Anaerolineae bacterium]